MEHVMKTYARQPVKVVRGEGCVLFDEAGKQYLDMVAGIAVCNLGHPTRVSPGTGRSRQTGSSTARTFTRFPSRSWWRRSSPSTHSLPGLFLHSGAEANEGAIKLVRKYFSTNGKRGPVIITCNESFHGRTLATLAATGQSKYRAGFDPVMPGFLQVPFGDINALKAAVTDQVGAVMLEPIQGEGGINVPPAEYLRSVGEFCDSQGILLVLETRSRQAWQGQAGSLPICMRASHPISWRSPRLWATGSRWAPW